MPRHCKKLVIPNMPPKIIPPTGPRAMAPMATGIMLKEMASGPIFKYPRGVKDIISKIAHSIAVVTIFLVSNFLCFI